MQITFHQVPCASLRLNRTVKMLQLHSCDFVLCFWCMGLILMSLQTKITKRHTSRSITFVNDIPSNTMYMNYPRAQSSRQYSWNTARFQDSLITRKISITREFGEENPANWVCSSHDWSLRNDELLVRIVRNQCYDRCRFVVHHRKT